MKFQKKYSLKIPNNINFLYCYKKNQITVIGSLKKKSLKTETKLFFVETSNLVIVSDIPVYKTSNVGKKKAKFMQGTTLSKIKHLFIETNYTLYHKLNFVGVGYRSFQLETDPNQIYFKLGYSHLVYFKIPNQFQTFCIRFTKLFIFGNSSYEKITQTASLIRDCKKPEPYKGKGILYHGEKILLKKGKKI